MEEENIQKSGVTIKTKFYIFILLIGVALTSWAVFYKDRSGNNIIGNDEVENETGIENETGMENENNIISDIVSNYLEGRLEKSDNPNKGNLKLVSSLGEIYIRTERDFNDLISADVLLSINGTLDNFELINIEKRLEKEGYIKSQQ